MSRLRKLQVVFLKIPGLLVKLKNRCIIINVYKGCLLKGSVIDAIQLHTLDELIHVDLLSTVTNKLLRHVFRETKCFFLNDFNWVSILRSAWSYLWI